MNPYTSTPGSAWQLFVSEPFNNTIAVVNLVVFGTLHNQVFGPASVSRISSPSLKLPVDLAPADQTGARIPPIPAARQRSKPTPRSTRR
jgi:hypothetical protein